ncbi:hypothetical protein EV361DRAFT_972726 [Lentinula raphanica]|nr:hypothetical protein FB446DRAFT_756038 [Lentinula raphanica]KAJ3968592.1 hypothetical protein EV361DRAFT_972726 [Lentinula raphanica]
MPSWTWTLLLVLSTAFGFNRLIKRPRTSIIRQTEERVLILGASNGIGREIAHQYAARGARVCVVGRRADKVMAVAEECRARRGDGLSTDVLGIPADITSVEDMVRVRTVLDTEWAGIDTIIIAAGVSATRPLLDVAGAGLLNADVSADKIQYAVSVTEAASRTNYLGPMIAAVSFIPLLQRLSLSPSILLISSLGAVIPAPTRSIYGSTKSASLLLYQALAIEHPTIRFSFVLPSTVEGDFRASAVDQPAPTTTNTQSAHAAHGTVGTTTNLNSTSGLKVDDVARRCIHAVDHAEKVVFIPSTMKFGHLLYWIWPSFIEKKAMKKYGFVAK